MKVALSNRKMVPMFERTNAEFSITIKGSVDNVWQQLVKTDDVQPWFDNLYFNVQGLRPGSRFSLGSPDKKLTRVTGLILKSDQPTCLSYTLKYTQNSDLPCKMTYGIRDEGGKVSVTLKVEDLQMGTDTESRITKNGAFILRTLKTVVEKNRVSLGIRWTMLMHKFNGSFM